MTSSDRRAAAAQEAAREVAPATATSPAPDEHLLRTVRVAVLAAVALALSYVETTIPLPLVFPGAKLGLANIAVLVALFAYDARTAVYVAFIKVLAAGFIFGSPLMMAYSLGGTALSVVGMLLLGMVPGISATVVSMAAAVLHNTGQVIVACLLLGTPAVFVSLPPLALVALVTGALTGVVASSVLDRLGGEEGEKGEKGEVDEATDAGPDVSGVANAVPRDPTAFGGYRPGDTLAHRLDARVKIVFVLLFFVAAFVAQGVAAMGVVVAASLAAMVASGVGLRLALKWLKPFWGLFIFVAVFDLLFTRTGDVLWAVGAVSITADGAVLAVSSVVRFACMALGTSSLMLTTSPDELTQGVGGLLAPLERLGLRTGDVVLALSLTLSFLPQVTGEFEAVKNALDAGDEPSSLRAFALSMRNYGLAFAPAFANALRRADSIAESLAKDPGRGIKPQTGQALSRVDYVVVACTIALVTLALVL